MKSKIDQLKSAQEAKEYNNKAAETMLHYGGCIGSRACEYCFAVISDSVCMCMPVFECPNCGKLNGKEFALEKMQQLGQEKLIISDSLGEKATVMFADEMSENDAGELVWKNFAGVIIDTSKDKQPSGISRKRVIY